MNYRWLAEAIRIGKKINLKTNKQKQTALVWQKMESIRSLRVNVKVVAILLHILLNVSNFTILFKLNFVK